MLLLFPRGKRSHRYVDATLKIDRISRVYFNCNIYEFYFAGELQVAKVNNVYRSAPYTDQKHGFLGTLFVTNFKISFLPSDCSSYEMASVKFSATCLHSLNYLIFIKKKKNIFVIRL